MPARPDLVPPTVTPPSTDRRHGAVTLRLTLPAFLAFGVSIAGAQPQPRANQANWALANRFTTEALRSVVYSTSVTPRWIGEKDSLWYNWRDSKGSAFYLVVPRTKTRQHLFDHTKMAAALSAAHRRAYDPQNLPFTVITFTDDWKAIRFDVDSTRYEWTLASEALRSLGRAPRDSTAQGGQGGRGGGGGGRGGGGANQDFRNYSPDSAAFVFAKDHNLYLVEVGKPDTVQLSKDGVRFYSFGSRDTTAITQQQENDQQDEQQQQGGRGQGQGARNRDPRVRAQATWSPDSKGFAIQRQDTRKVSDLFLVNSLSNPRPTLTTYKYAMPGEENVAQQELFVYKRGETQLTPVNVRRWKDQRIFDVHWTAGSDKLRLVRRDRLQRNLELIEVDLVSKAIRSLISESVENASLERQNVRYVFEDGKSKRGDMIWWSERSGWGHYYLYDHNGTLKRSLTSGPWRAEAVIGIDSLKRVAWIAGVGREEGENPYYRHMYRLGLDGGPVALLDPGNANHNSSLASLSPSKRYLVDNFSRIDLPAKAVIRDGTTGAVVMNLEETDMSRLREIGWQAPQPFVVKAADGVTDIYGNMWRPFDFDSTKTYPIIAHVYPGPQTESVTPGFAPTAVTQRLAQLGFIVIQIGNRGGSPQRSNAYQSFGYYNLRDYGLADKKAGIEQLAARHKWIDIERVGIFGHSGGGFMTAAALLQPPYNDFFKVGVSSSGNHDNNVYNQNWSEQYHGLREVIAPKTNAIAGATNGSAAGGESQDAAAQGGGGANGAGAGGAIAADDPDPKFSIKVPANHELAANLKGRLLLVHGDMDNNVHPAGTIRLVDALIKANKRFDFMLLPGKPHGFGDLQPYFTQLMAEYFAEHLLGDYYRTGATMR
jgi:dipeptidyl aminopeptidase/acylaminoacyl peptidase